jgi:hypothetical protein
MPRLSKIGAAALAAFGWTGLSSVSASYLVVAGGGGSGGITGGQISGGGGAGGLLTGTASLNPTQSYTITVGAGGTGTAASADTNGNQGGSSSLGSLVSTTGGGGGGGTNPTSGVGGSGGSGGGNAYTNQGTGGLGTVGQGNNGGAGAGGAASPAYGAGGGGGASAVGAAGTTSAGGNGGNGTASSISGSSVTYAGGGGGGAYVGNTVGTGGTGGGGNGSTNSNVPTNGTANLGGGGGGVGGDGSTARAGANGGSGIVIISYVGAQQFGGGVVTSSGGNTIHTFTTSGTLSPLSSLTASYLIVAGGGGGSSSSGGGGGGGAGGLLSGSSLTIDTNSIYAVTVGSGGAGGLAATISDGTAGSNSSFSMVSTSAVGGGQGVAQGVGGNGGSGGGAGDGNNAGVLAGGTATSGQGNNGGSSANQTGGGGGGAGAVGGNGNASGNAGNGGNGTASSISGSSVTYAGGGGGGQNSAVGTGAGTGGSGGGGAGGRAAAGTAGTANLGGGGGGGGRETGVQNFNGGTGGSGIVIISYPGTSQQMAGGTVTVAGGNVIHTFTSSGYLTPIVLVNNSLRFRSSASAYLNRTPSVTTGRQVLTISFWCKRGKLGSSQNLVYASDAGAANYSYIFFNSSDQLNFATAVSSVNKGEITTNAVFRDPSAWYHVVLSLNFATPSATIYVNGVTQSVTVNTALVSSNLAWLWTGANNFIGSNVTPANFFDGYLAEVNFIDGQALTPNSFGSFNGLGVWQPIRYGGSYGTNGFYLPFPNSGAVTANYLVVAGGGGGGIGGGGGGGGAGGLRSTVTATGGGGSLESALTLNAGNSYTVTVGAGGAGGISEALGTSGSNSVFSTITSTGGGGGSYASSSQGTPLGSGALSGGSGGGGSAWRNSLGTTSTQSNAAGTANQGFAGGSAPTQSTNSVGTGGGGGGAGALGADAVQNTSSGAGGAGVAVAITGSSVTYGGGGGGGGSNASAGTGGSGGGGAGANSAAGNPGTNGLGGGGGGGSSGTGGSGGSGIVIVSYAGTPKFTGGVVSQVGGNTIHTFTSSGTLNGIGSDYSPNGNNWTANNFSFSSGSTYDSMTDVPTLTSATTANYAVMNPLVAGTSSTLSNGNLTYTNSAGTGNQALSSMFVTSGSYYFEATLTTAGGGGASVFVHVGDGNTYYATNGEIYSGGVLQTTVATLTSGDVVGLAFTPGSSVTYYKNGTSVFTGGVGGIVPFVNGFSGTVWNLNFGQRPFAYTPPSGFVALNTFNLPTPTIGATAATTANKYMNIALYTGTGSSQSITGLGFQPDWTWIKERNAAADHGLYDAVRGVQIQLESNNTGAETTETTGLTAFGSDGFTVGALAQLNTSADTYVAWNWKANGAGSSNTDGTITSTVSANTTAGFSIVTYTGNATSAQTVGHGLGVTPTFFILKSRGIQVWNVYSLAGGITGNTVLELNSTDGANTGNNISLTASSTTIGFGSAAQVNGSGVNFVAYCFAPIAGYSAFGSYTGNGSTDGPFIFTGFRPRWIMFKQSSSSGAGWLIYDSARNTYNLVDLYLQANQSNAEAGNSTDNPLDFLSNGFKLRYSNSATNQNSATYIYMAFAENPFKYANAR